MRRLVFVFGVALGAVIFFFAVLRGFHDAVEEMGGRALADHSLDFCPNWLLGVFTGALGVGLCWWLRERMREDLELVVKKSSGVSSGLYRRIAFGNARIRSTRRLAICGRAGEEEDMDEKSRKSVVDDLRNSLYHLSDAELSDMLGQYPEDAARLRACLGMIGGPHPQQEELSGVASLDDGQREIYARVLREMSASQLHNFVLAESGKPGSKARVVLRDDELDVLLSVLGAP